MVFQVHGIGGSAPTGAKGSRNLCIIASPVVFGMLGGKEAFYINYFRGKTPTQRMRWEYAARSGAMRRPDVSYLLSSEQILINIYYCTQERPNFGQRFEGEYVKVPPCFLCA